MAIKVGMTVRTIKACGGLTREGIEDLPEGTKGTVLTIDEEGSAGARSALISRKDGLPVYVQLAHLVGCKGRPLKAVSLAKAIEAAKVPAVRLVDETVDKTAVA